jgi:hypothetical protein
MNERIKELSLQASDSIPDDVSAEHAMYLFQEKFAELIVRECDRYAKSAWEHGPLLGRDLLIHFGIVEAEDN